MPRELSRHLRRNGGAVVQYAAELDWTPTAIVQVGVGLNCHEVGMLREAFPEASFTGYEPSKKNFNSVKPNYPGTLHRLALADYTGSGQLNKRPRHADGASLCQIDGAKSAETVVVWTLNRCHQEHGPFYNALLWLDCEGRELQVLQAADDVLPHVLMVNVEITTRTDKRAGDWCHARDVHGLLNKHGFVRVATHTHRSCIGQADAVYVARSLLELRDAWWMCWCPCQEWLRNE